MDPRFEFEPTVDVAVPTYNESIELLEETLAACLALNYPNKTVWLLDDGNRPEVKALAQRIGCRYVTRLSNHGAKAGNLNNAMREMTGQFLLVFDADVSPCPDFLTTVMPRMQDCRMGFVQSAWRNINLDPIEAFCAVRKNDEKGGGIRQALYKGFAASCGSSVLYRRAALDDVGGFPMRTVCEDIPCGFAMHHRGWRSDWVFLPLATGQAASGLSNFMKQQLRWVLVCWQILALTSERGELFSKQQTAKAKLLYSFLLGMRLLEAFYLPLLLLPAVLLVAVHSCKRLDLAWGLLLGSMALTTLSRWGNSFLLGQGMSWGTLYSVVMAWPLAKQAVRFVVNPFGERFYVTRKMNEVAPRQARKESAEKTILYPLIVLSVVYALSMCCFVDSGIQSGVIHTAPFFAVCLLIWSAVNLGSIAVAIGLWRRERLGLN